MNFEESYSYDDLLLLPQYSEVMPSQVTTESPIAKDLTLKTPIFSSAMDTVTEAPMAKIMALAGGLGVIHKNLTLEKQVNEISLVKNYSLSEVERKEFPIATLSKKNQLRVGAAVGVDASSRERVEALVAAGCDLIAVDTAHGHSKNVLEMVSWIAKKFPETVLVAGNVVTEDGTWALIEAGVDVVKVGVGPGSICTTRIVAGVGMAQATAVLKCARVAHEKGKTIIADGGIKYSGDIAKAFALGANAVMLGNLLAGTDESPGPNIVIDGRNYKEYRGMGSVGAMSSGSKDRYFQSDVDDQNKFVPEGIEGRVLYRGSARPTIFQLIGGVRSSMGYVGAKTLSEFRQKAKFMRITGAGLRESHVHDVQITKEAPNYRVGIK